MRSASNSKDKAKLLEVTGVIAAGKGIFFTTGGGNQARELPGFDFLGALKHHVFQDMGHAGFTVNFV
jgi:hypothetical protein